MNEFLNKKLVAHLVSGSARHGSVSSDGIMLSYSRRYRRFSFLSSAVFICLLLALVFNWSALWSRGEPKQKVAMIAFLPFGPLMSAGLILSARNRKIFFGHDGIAEWNFIGRRKFTSWSEVASVEHDPIQDNVVIKHVGGNKTEFSALFDGFEELKAMLVANPPKS